jgi:hypothetical protein
VQFLDWARYSEWNPRHIKTIEATPPKPVEEVRPGDKLKVQLEGMAFSPVVLVRTCSFCPVLTRFLTTSCTGEQ